MAVVTPVDTPTVVPMGSMLGVARALEFAVSVNFLPPNALASAGASSVSQLDAQLVVVYSFALSAQDPGLIRDQVHPLDLI